MEILEIDDVQFILDNRAGALRAKSEGNKYVLGKTRHLLDFYESLRPEAPKNIFEIGMFEGGSLIYFDKLYAPKILVGVEIRRKPIPALEQYKQARPHIKTYYGCSQDSPRARGAAQSNFPEGVDLVVDDASHLYAETKKTFENIFPLVRTGGWYVIEDWAWAHRGNPTGAGAAWNSRPALTNLIFELTVLAAISRVIDRITINGDLFCVKKGRGMLPETKLDISGRLRDRDMPLI